MKLMDKKIFTMVPSKFCVSGPMGIYLFFLAWVTVFRIIPEFRVLRLTFHRKSASKYRSRQIVLALRFMSVCLKTDDHLNLKLLIFSRHIASFRPEFLKFRIFEILNFHPCVGNIITNTNTDIVSVSSNCSGKTVQVCSLV